MRSQWTQTIQYIGMWLWPTTPGLLSASFFFWFYRPRNYTKLPGHISANTRTHQLCWDHKEMGNTISSTETQSCRYPYSGVEASLMQCVWYSGPPDFPKSLLPVINHNCHMLNTHKADIQAVDQRWVIWKQISILAFPNLSSRLSPGMNKKSKGKGRTW